MVKKIIAAVCTAAVTELTAQITVLKEKLTFADKEAVLTEKEKLEKKQKELKSALTTAEGNYGICKEELAAIRAAIGELNKQFLRCLPMCWQRRKKI